MKYAQLFCSVMDMVSDKQAPGVDEARMFQAIQAASDWMQKQLGRFIPVTLTYKFTGDGSTKLLIPPRLLSIESIMNDDVTLSASDYLLKPDHGFWANGPFGKLEFDIDIAPTLYWSAEPNGIEIVGHWGKYERIGDTGATVQDNTQQSSSQTTLKVSNGGAISPGMVLLIGSEQESVIGWEAPTENVTAINMTSGLAAQDDVMTVDDASKVNIGEIIRLEFEQCRVKDRQLSTNKLALLRGWNGTGRVLHANDVAVDVYRTVTVERSVNGSSAAVHAKDTSISRYMVPDDILLLTKEIATLSVNKAMSGYQGRTGNNDTGVIYYNDIFPRYDIETIKCSYRIPRVG